MIAKGNCHAHGVKLASYLMTGHPGERAELIGMRGFGAATDLRDGFRAQQIVARDGTKAEQPFFHAQFRSVDGEGAKKLMVGKVFDFLADFIAAPPPPTRAQVEDMQRAAPEREQEAAARTEYQQNEAARAELMEQYDREKKQRAAEPGYFRPIYRPGEIERDEGRERGRERD